MAAEECRKYHSRIALFSITDAAEHPVAGAMNWWEDIRGCAIDKFSSVNSSSSPIGIERSHKHRPVLHPAQNAAKLHRSVVCLYVVTRCSPTVEFPVPETRHRPPAGWYSVNTGIAGLIKSLQDRTHPCRNHRCAAPAPHRFHEIDVPQNATPARAMAQVYDWKCSATAGETALAAP